MASNKDHIDLPLFQWAESQIENDTTEVKAASNSQAVAAKQVTTRGRVFRNLHPSDDQWESLGYTR